MPLLRVGILLNAECSMMYSSHTLWRCQPPPSCSHLSTLTTKLRLWQKGSGGSKRSGGFIKSLAAWDEDPRRLLLTISVVIAWWCSLASCLLVEENSGLAQVGTHCTRLSFLSPAPANKTSVPRFFVSLAVHQWKGTVC